MRIFPFPPAAEVRWFPLTVLIHMKEYVMLEQLKYSVLRCVVVPDPIRANKQHISIKNTTNVFLQECLNSSI